MTWNNFPFYKTFSSQILTFSFNSTPNPTNVTATLNLSQMGNIVYGSLDLTNLKGIVQQTNSPKITLTSNSFDSSIIPSSSKRVGSIQATWSSTFTSNTFGGTVYELPCEVVLSSSGSNNLTMSIYPVEIVATAYAFNAVGYYFSVGGFIYSVSSFQTYLPSKYEFQYSLM